MVYILVKGDFHFIAQLLLWMKTLIVQNPEYLTDFSRADPWVVLQTGIPPRKGDLHYQLRITPENSSQLPGATLSGCLVQPRNPRGNLLDMLAWLMVRDFSAFI